MPQRLWALRQHAQRMLDGPSVDVVSAHFALYALPVLDLLGDRPLIVHFHGPWAEESAVEGSRAANVRLKALIERTVYRRAARCIVLSSAFRDVLHHTYGVPLHRIRIVPGGVEVNRFATTASTQDARATLGWDDRPTVLVVRRLAERMGLTELVEAAAMVREEHPELQVLIAGKGPLHDTLQQAIAAHHLEKTMFGCWASCRTTSCRWRTAPLMPRWCRPRRWKASDSSRWSRWRQVRPCW